MSSIAIEIGHEHQGIRLAYVDGAPGIRVGLYNEKSSLMFYPGDDLMFSPGGDLMFENPPSTYPGLRVEVLN